MEKTINKLLIENSDVSLKIYLQMKLFMQEYVLLRQFFIFRLNRPKVATDKLQSLTCDVTNLLISRGTILSFFLKFDYNSKGYTFSFIL